MEFATAIPFGGQWAWSVDRFARAIQTDQLLFRLDWLGNEPTAATLYCRFPAEPRTEEFQKTIAVARGFSWNGPDVTAISAALGVKGVRGVAFRASDNGHLRTAIYFRVEQHVGSSWCDRLMQLLQACHYPQDLAITIETDLKELYRPGPLGVIGVDDGNDGVPSAVKFDPSNVPLESVLRLLARIGAPKSRISTLTRLALGLRAESVTYAGVQYGSHGRSGFRLYFACEYSSIRRPGGPVVLSQNTLRPIRRVPHY
jgi:hypothetical protein